MPALPDAPWIRDAENNGMPSAEPVTCPICGSEAEVIYTDLWGDALGCDRCVIHMDAYDWRDEHAED